MRESLIKWELALLHACTQRAIYSCHHCLTAPVKSKATRLLMNIHFFTTSHWRHEQSVPLKIMYVYTNGSASINTTSTSCQNHWSIWKNRLEEFVQTRHRRHIAGGWQRRLARKHTFGHLKLRTYKIISKPFENQLDYSHLQLQQDTSRPDGWIGGTLFPRYTDQISRSLERVTDLISRTRREVLEMCVFTLIWKFWNIWHVTVDELAELFFFTLFWGSCRSSGFRFI